MAETIGVVLAGGQSRRMGEPKERMLLDTDHTMTWLDHARRRLDLVCDRVLISGSNANGIPDYPGLSGPVAGMATLLRQCMDTSPGTLCLFLPVDMPRVTVESLQTLLHEARTAEISQSLTTSPLTPHTRVPGKIRKEEQPGIAVAVRDSLFPLCIPAQSEWATRALQVAGAVRPGERSVKAFIAREPHAVTWFAPRAKEEFANINTPAQWAAFSLAAERKESGYVRSRHD